MDAALIDQLAARDPRLKVQPTAALCGYGSPPDLRARATFRFATRYKNVAFGWSIAQAFARYRKPFPITMLGRDSWVYRAYMLCIDSYRWGDDSIMEAYAIATLPSLRALKGKLCGLLLSGFGHPPDEHRRRVGKTMGIKLDTIEAFDTLFYNVLDRQGDMAYISEEVYPDGRMIEFAEDYLRNSDMSALLKRAGFNHRDLELSAYLAGVGDQSYLSRLSARTDREQELTRQLMGNGLLLAAAGALNQKSVGISRTTAMLAATRQSGQTVETPAIADAGDYVADDLRAALANADEQRRALLREDAGADVEDTAMLNGDYQDLTV